jgi:acetyl-CoA C-acetyltransferase
MKGREVYVVAAARTAVGSFLGALKDVPAVRLGATAIRGALRRAGLEAAKVDEVYMGCVLTGGLGQAPARQAWLFADEVKETPCTTIGKVCGSGLQAIILGAKAVALGDCEIVVAGGMESMSGAPFVLPKARQGYRMGQDIIVDMMIKDGLWDVYNDIHMGSCAELCAKEYGFTRELQDAFAIDSYRKANEAVNGGQFDREIVPVEIAQRKGDPIKVARDEEPGRGDPKKMPSLRPAFDPKSGTVTAGNASSINDGGAAVVLASPEAVKANGLKPIARVVSYGGAAHAPEWFTTAPVPAMRKSLERAGWKASDVDLWEINEAFSCVTMAGIRDLELDAAKVNLRGGAVAIGHPIGASGARIFVTLVHLLEDKKAHKGMTGICLGGGEALSVAVER